MNALPVHRSQPQSRTRTEQMSARFGACAPAAAVVHHQYEPGQLPSLMTGGRSLRGGCAVRRQTGAQAGNMRAVRYPAIRPTRRVGRYFASAIEFIEVDSLLKAGVDSRVAAQLVAQQSIAPGSVQGISERDPSVHSSLSSEGTAQSVPPTEGQNLGNPFQTGPRHERRCPL